ncbi:MAG: hypothetical protein JXB04_09690 [Kiritimatiellae bacterium]|nr:hypothetical protein [Kiritimatiellia bacterium]
MKWFKIAIIALVVLLAVILIVASFFLGSIIKTGVETGGPAVLGVPVTLEKASVSPLRGRANLKELVIGNPEGFKSPHLFKLGELTVLMDMASLASDTIVIKKIQITGPDISYEKSLKTSNIGQLLKNLEGEEKPAEEKPKEEEKEEPPPEKAEGGKKVVIEDFLLEGGKIHLSATLTGGKAIMIPLPPVHMTDIGKDSGGASPKEIITTVFSTVLGSVTKAVGASVEFVGDGVKMVGGAATEAVGAAGDAALKGAEVAGDAAKKTGEAAMKGAQAVSGAAAEGVDKAGDAAKKVGSAVGGGAKKAVGGVTGLFKKEKAEGEE